MNRILGIGLVLLLLALGLALYQLNSLQREVRLLQKQTADLQELTKHAPIRFVGTFPHNMSSLTQLAQATINKLLVVGDFCAYGHYSNPEAYREYLNALEELPSKGAAVEMFLYNDDTAQKATLSQFPTDFSNITNDPKFKHYFDDLHPHLAKPHTVKEFTTAINAEQDTCVRELQTKGVKVYKTITATLPLFIWLRDNKEAIFSVYNLGDEAREVSLSTTDDTLNILLQEIYTQAIKGAAVQATVQPPIQPTSASGQKTKGN
jgi:hypothetical protein